MSKYVPIEWTEAKAIDIPIGEYARLHVMGDAIMRKVNKEALELVFCDECVNYKKGKCRRTLRRTTSRDFCSRGMKRCK